MNIKPYYYQEPIPNIVFNYIASNKHKHPLVALPTAAGKTIVIADIVEQAINNWGINVLIISHVKEILEQDYETLIKHTNLDVGIYSAGLERREVKQVTVAGIQSIFRKSDLFKDYQLVIIDEAHLIPPGDNGMYKKLFAGLPISTVYLGLTATKYRLGQGYIYGQEDTLFDDCVYDYTEYEKFNELTENGFLCELRTQRTRLKLDVEGIGVRGGDFIEIEMSKKFDREKITNAAVDETIDVGKDYKKWLVFAIDIEHAEHIAERLNIKGIPTAVIHSKMDDDRDKIIKLFREGKIKCIVNVNILTTGFNDKEIDLIVLLRPTKSPVLHVQMIGRGLRVIAGKLHCMVLDFAGNVKRLGPINAIKVKRKDKGAGGEPITKDCPDCNLIHHPRVKVCPCGHVFEFKHGLDDSFGLDIVYKENQWLDITDVSYVRHKKKGVPNSIKVTYVTDQNVIVRKWVCLQHKGYPGISARHWLERHIGEERAEKILTTDELLDATGDLKVPKQIMVNVNNKYPEVMDYKF